MCNIKICVCIPYFGKLPANMKTYLLSCSENKAITFMIFTDDPEYKNLNQLYKNVIFIKSNLPLIRKRLINITGITDITLNKPYKLCDYRPLFGKIFYKYLKGYDYWGYSDLDVVYGDLMPFIRYGIRHGYEKIGKLGHFTLIHNDVISNNRYKLPIFKNGKKIYLFRDIVSRTDQPCGFDEFNGIDIIYKQYHIRTYCNLYLVNEIHFTTLDLNTINLTCHTRNQCYIWHNGHAEFFYLYKNVLVKKEYGYFHFQKRRAFKDYLHSVNNIFSVTTYGYNNMNKLNEKSIKQVMKMNKSPFYKRLRYKLHSYFLTNYFVHRAHIGKLRLPVRYLFIQIFINHNSQIFKI